MDFYLKIGALSFIFGGVRKAELSAEESGNVGQAWHLVAGAMHSRQILKQRISQRKKKNLGLPIRFAILKILRKCSHWSVLGDTKYLSTEFTANSKSVSKNEMLTVSFWRCILTYTHQGTFSSFNFFFCFYLSCSGYFCSLICLALD